MVFFSRLVHTFYGNCCLNITSSRGPLFFHLPYLFPPVVLFKLPPSLFFQLQIMLMFVLHSDTGEGTSPHLNALLLFSADGDDKELLLPWCIYLKKDPMETSECFLHVPVRTRPCGSVPKLTNLLLGENLNSLERELKIFKSVLFLFFSSSFSPWLLCVGEKEVQCSCSRISIHNVAYTSDKACSVNRRADWLSKQSVIQLTEAYV